MMDNFEHIPVVNVTKDNVEALYPALKKAIENSSYIAMDCELSGLGDRNKLNRGHMDERYSYMSQVARTYSVISVGISTFQLISCDNQTGKCWKYLVQTFNVLTLCEDPYMVDSNSLRFLVEHHFDFNEQYRQGISYYRGNDRQSSTPQYIRDVFQCVVAAKKPVVFHNGLLDLVFLYQNFYADLPKLWGSFTADLLEMFGESGIYDTKYISDYHARLSASYLQIAFKKMQILNLDHEEEEKPHVDLMFCDYGACPWVENRSCPIPDLSQTVPDTHVCQEYANHGFCPSQTCKLSHDINDIVRSSVATENHQKRRQRKRKYKQGSEVNGCLENGVEDKNNSAIKKSLAEGVVVSSNSGGHRAGLDAFMTGFCLSVLLVRHTGLPLHPRDYLPATIHSETIVNKIYLICCSHPVVIHKSLYSKPSQLCKEKLQKITANKT